MPSRLAALLLLLLCAAACVRGAPETAGPVRLTVTSEKLPLDPADPARRSIGRLAYMGGLVLRAGDPRFGGLSGLRWDKGGLVAVSDRGDFIILEPREDNGRLTGITKAILVPMRDPEGQPLTGKADAEALTGDGAGGWLVAFERDHRIWRYPDLDGPALPTGIDPQALLGSLAGNQGVEAIAGTMQALFLCSERQDSPARANCAVLPGGRPAHVAVAARGRAAFVPTDADRLDEDSIALLFRSYSRWDGAAATLAIWREGAGVIPLAALEPPLSVDNMEGIAIRHEGGRTYVYIVSDDNFSPLQRTLLMKFRLEQFNRSD